MSAKSRERAAKLVKQWEDGTLSEERDVICTAEHQLDGTGRTFPCFDLEGHEDKHVDEYGREWV